MNKKFFFLILNSIITTSCVANLNIMLESKKLLMNERDFALIKAQAYATQSKQVPKISDAVIKEIPIVGSEEALIDLRHANSPRISMMPNPSKPFESPDCNAGFAASSKVRATLHLKLHDLIHELDHLAPHFGYQMGQVEIKVFEGLRDIATQKMLFDNKMKEIQQTDPSMTEEQSFTQTCKWVSPVINNVPVHSTGAAVDIRLWDTINQQFLDMGKFGVIWGANPSAPTFSEENLTEEQQKNRLYLIMAATNAGLTNYLYEWWHYSYGDRYASYWREADASKRKADYGSI